MINPLLILFGKILSFLSQILNLGHGSTWPGHIALSLNKNVIKDILINSQTKIILIAGTNGKTTTGKLVRTILEQNGNSVFQNESGANLLNGVTSSIVLHSAILGELKYNYAIFEVDENSLSLVLQELTPDYVILLNLFRDQLDRYGEVNTIATKWGRAIEKLPPATTLILNADDPQIAYLGKDHKLAKYFGLNHSLSPKISHQHAADSIYCPSCGVKLFFHALAYSHVGEWECKKCKLKRPAVDLSYSPIFPLEGEYNKYNTIAAVLLARLLNVSDEVIESSLADFKPAFGRQEIITINRRKISIFLSKNPTSFNQSLRTVQELGAKHILFVLNDRIPDGRDVSWIWDVDFEEFLNPTIIISVAGDRALDMSLRLKYSHPVVKQVDTHYPLLEKAVESAIDKVPKGETLYILPTYSAMLEVRKILTGKKIL